MGGAAEVGGHLVAGAASLVEVEVLEEAEAAAPGKSLFALTQLLLSAVISIDLALFLGPNSNP